MGRLSKATRPVWYSTPHTGTFIDTAVAAVLSSGLLPCTVLTVFLPVVLPVCPLAPCRDATPEEQEMEAEVEGLRKQLEELQTATPDETDTIGDLKKELDEKERALYTLQVRPRLTALGLGWQGISLGLYRTGDGAGVQGTG